MRGIHHAGIVVSDIHRAIDFYTGILGLELMAELTPPNEGPQLERVLNLPGAKLHAGAMLQAGASAIELHEFVAPEWSGERPIPAHAIGAQHVAFWCDDLASEKAAIEARGGVFMTDINVVDKGPFAGLRTAFIQDPDGVRIEFLEVAYWLDEQRRAGVAEYWAGRRDNGDTND
jgi:catechol 2,3-dioxygenase-like lactoylglutathione lyase family enzyme